MTTRRQPPVFNARLSHLALLKNQILIFGDFWLGKIRKSEKNQNKNQLTNTSINLGVMGMSTLVHTVRVRLAGIRTYLYVFHVELVPVPT